MILVRQSRAQQLQMLLDMKTYLHKLNVHLHHSILFYFRRPKQDDGARAQAFVDTIMLQLATVDKDVAFHFGAGSDLVMVCASYDSAPARLRQSLERMAMRLKIPEELKAIPGEHLFDWARKILHHFKSTITRPYDPGLSDKVTRRDPIVNIGLGAIQLDIVIMTVMRTR